MKFLVKQQNQRTHLQLYKDKNIDILNVNRVLNQAIDKKELQDVVQSLHSSETITHFTHHSDKQSMDEDFNAEQRIKQLQQQLDPQYLNKQTLQQQQAIRTTVHQQTTPLQEKLSLLQQIQQIIKQGLAENQHITYLDLSNTFMRDNLALELSKMFVTNKQLLHINLSGNSLMEKGGLAVVNNLSQNKVLQYLNLSHNNLTPKVIENLATALEANTNLTNLNLSHNSQGRQILASDSIAAILENNELITTLDLNNMNLGSQGLNKLFSVVQQHILRDLNIAGNGLDINSVEQLAQILSSEESKLLHLNISNNAITIEGLVLLANSLKHNNSLEILELSQIGNLGKEGGQHLSLFLTDNKSLLKLDISNNNLSYIGAKFLAKGLSVNSSLVQINISNNNLDEAGCIFISEALETNNSLTTLNLKDNHVQSTGSIYLAAMLEQYNHIQYLNLTGNQINDTGIEALASVMHNLKALNLSNNQITTNDAGFLAETLKSGVALKILILNNNCLQVAGALEIISALKDNFALHTLGLKSVNIGDAGVAQIVPTLLENISIAILDLGSNSISKNGAMHIANLLKDNSFITSVNLTGNQLTEGGEVLLTEALAVSNVTSLGDITDKSGSIRKALSINVNKLQTKLKSLNTEDIKDFTSEDLFKLYHQILARKESNAPELSYSDIKDDTAYLKQIDTILQTIKNQKQPVHEEKENYSPRMDLSTEDILLNVLEAIDILGNVEQPFDLIY